MKTPLVHGSGSRALVRLLLLVLVVAVCAWGFSVRFEKKMAEIDARAARAELSGSFSDEGTKQLATVIAEYRKELGITVLVTVTDGDVLLPELSGSKLFVGISREREQAQVVFPHLVKKAVHDDELARMKDSVAKCVYGEEDTGLCLAMALENIYLQLQK